MRLSFFKCLIVLIFFTSQVAFAQIYKCKLPTGKIEYQSAPCKNGDEISNKLSNTKSVTCVDEDGKNCISLTFRSMDVKNVLQVLADYSGNKLVIDDAVKGSGTFVYSRQTWKKVLQDIASKYNLVATIDNGKINVKSK
jgi:type II secretory pathway component GspD/PulD (secretin)